MKRTPRKTVLVYAISEAHDEIYSLAEDMRDVFERTPPQFQETTGRPREQAADNLAVAADLLQDDEVPKVLRDEEVEWMEMIAGKDEKFSRPAQRDNVVRCLGACVTRLSRLPQDDDTTKLKAEWQRAIDVLKGVYFPGMRGPRRPVHA